LIAGSLGLVFNELERGLGVWVRGFEERILIWEVLKGLCD